MYCTYVTFYRGNKLPPFYIGYSTVDRVNAGYHGSVSSVKYRSIWIKEQQENPHLFVTKILSTFSYRSDAKSAEASLQRNLKVHRNPLYINQHIQGEKFMCDRTGFIATEKTREKMRNRPCQKHTEQTKEKISRAKKGIKFTAEHCSKISTAVNARGPDSNETRLKKSNSRKGLKHSIETLAKLSASSQKCKAVVVNGNAYKSKKEAWEAEFPGLCYASARKRM